MTPAVESRPSWSDLIAWTGVGALTASAALALMFGLAMVGLSGVEDDASEAGFGFVFAGISVGAWVLPAVLAGRVVFKRSSRWRGLMAVVPALISVVWCGLAAALTIVNAAAVLPAWLESFGVLSSVVALSLFTAGALPVVAALLVANVVLRLVNDRRKARSPLASRRTMA